MTPTPSTRTAIAGSLREMAGLLALAGESPFRARAYERAATAIEHLDVDLAALVEAGRLTELPGIGRGIAAMIAELQRTGRSKALDALRERMPPGSLPWDIPGTGKPLSWLRLSTNGFPSPIRIRPGVEVQLQVAGKLANR